jgi:multidrug resistance efflux pump
VSPSTPPVPFDRSRSLLAADGFRRWLLRLALILAFAGAWLAWFAGAEIGVYEVAERARLEAAAAVHPVDAPVAGRLDAVHVRLGQEVAAGEPLFDLDAEGMRFELAEAETRLAAQQRQLAAVEHEIELVARLLGQERETAGERLRTARSQQEVETITGRVAENEHERARRLHELGLVSDLDRLRALGEVDKSRARAAAESASVGALEAELRGDETDLATRAAHLEHERTALAGESAALAAHTDHLRYEIAERRITAPVAGRVGRLAELRAGAVVAPGQRLAEVVPDGEIRAVAWFAPSALGRLRPGQSAWLRLDAYPWTEYGALPATVERVAGEPADGGLRAELALAGAPSEVPLQHGLTATAEVAVERLTPARWVLRAAGGLWRPAAEPRG